jgi:hypothetical protein
MATATATPTRLGEVLATLAIDTSETTYTLVDPGNQCKEVQFVSDVAWLYSHKTGGPFLPVGASQTLTLPILRTQVNQVLFVKTPSGSGTLYALTVG